MKKIILLINFWVGLLLPLFIYAQHVTEYRPAGALLTSSVVNLESLRGTSPLDAVAGYTRSVNTVRESATSASNDIWYVNASQAGVAVNSFRYGNAGINERASAIERCANGDYIVLGITAIGGFDRILAFRIPAAGGAPIWAFTYFTANIHTRGYCIKRTNDTNESYMIAGTNSLAGGASPDKTLIALKINAAGAMLWNRSYFDPVVPNNTFDQPRSMVVVGNIHYITGNRTLGSARNIFAIGVSHTGGGIGPLYNYYSNPGFQSVNPFINVSNAGGFVLVYTLIPPMGASLVVFTALNAGLSCASTNSSYFFEPGASVNYGHTIYPSPGGGGYDIGGGVTVGGIQNPIFFSINNAGGLIANSYRRLWPTQNFTSTFMLRDQATPGVNLYAHHNYRPGNNPNGMSVMRNNGFCNISPQLENTVTPVTCRVNSYSITSVLTSQLNPLQNQLLTGQFFNCSGGTGAFRKTGTIAADEQVIAGGSFKVYPALAGEQTGINIEVDALHDASGVVSVYNMQAQRVLQSKAALRKGSNRFIIDIASLPRGTFIIEFRTGTAVMKTELVK